MSPTSPSVRIPVADLLRRPGSSRAVEVDAPVPGLDAAVAAVPAERPVHLDLTLERVGDGIVVRGTVRARWEAQCSRCLRPVGGTVEVHVDELFERVPLEGETYELDDDVADLEPMIRDALVLELPVAPLCAPGCAGLCPVCGADRNERRCHCATDDVDPRWAALRSLDL